MSETREQKLERLSHAAATLEKSFEVTLDGSRTEPRLRAHSHKGRVAQRISPLVRPSDQLHHTGDGPSIYTKARI